MIFGVVGPKHSCVHSGTEMPQVARGGVYLWRTMDGARCSRNAAWLERVRTTCGSKPVVQYFETPMVADNSLPR